MYETSKKMPPDAKYYRESDIINYLIDTYALPANEDVINCLKDALRKKCQKVPAMVNGRKYTLWRAVHHTRPKGEKRSRKVYILEEERELMLKAMEGYLCHVYGWKLKETPAGRELLERYKGMD